jgi:DNA adenine methylase
VLSNSDTPFIRELYRDFRIDTVWARRAINSRADRRGPVTEVLVAAGPAIPRQR